MPQPTPEQIADIVLGRRQVYDLDTDSHIRQLANRLTARALFEWLARFDDQAPDFKSQLAAFLRDVPGESVSGVIAFDTGDIPVSDDSPQPTGQPSEHYLRLVFSDKEAAYYQFHLFPDLDADYVLSAARKRTGAVQHIRLTLSHPGALQTFIESCRSNPHFVRVEESTPDEFHQAPSHGV